MFTPNSKLGELSKNPIGYDLIDQFGDLLKIDLFKMDFLGKLKLKDLTTISAGVIDKGAIEKVCEVLNSEEEDTIENDCQVEPKWWKEAVFYQIYPRSFCDSDGDGVGDIQGIISKLDYLKDLGIDCIWCCPMYDSPNDDNGYDIRDYKKIMAEFGTMEDFDQLLDEVHKRGMKLIMDLVVNHTSDEHEWFVNAKSSVDNPYHDYYLWRDGNGDGKNPPNNWKCMFSGSAWNYYENIDQWALHVFSKKQMDLNWDNPNVRRDVYEMMNFWFEKGIDGFRMDVINFISKCPELPNGVPFFEMATGYLGAENYFYGPKLHEYLREMRRETFGKYDCVTVGEMAAVGLEMAKMVTADKRKELDMIFTFDHVDNNGHTKYDDYAYDMREAVNSLMKYQTKYTNHCWPAVFFENHDIPRITSKVDASNTYRQEIAKLVATIQLTFRGCPFIYQGQEIAMTNCEFDGIDELRDVEGINLYHELVGKKKSPEKAFAKVMAGSRDHSRTPVQWDDSQNAGFTTGTPWIKVNKDSVRYNVKNQLDVPDSTLNHFKKLIKLRHENKALVYGDLVKIESKNKDVLCYYRELDGEKYFVELNLVGKTSKRWHDVTAYTPLALSNGKITIDYLKPYEANVYKV